MFMIIVRDIRFWILVFFCLRMYGITNPPLELHHTWRQTDGTTIARNFYDRNPNILFPTIDLAGEREGVVGSEFPILNYIVYIISLFFGYQHWYGRLVVLIASSLGALFFCKVILIRFSKTAAFNGAVLLMGSFWFSYSRKFLPDVFAASLAIIALYYAFMYLKEGKVTYLILFTLLGGLGCLSKILAATILTVLMVPIFDAGIPLQRKFLLSLGSFMILTVVVWWYFIWVQYLNATYGISEHFFMGMSYSDGIQQIIEGWKSVLRRLFISPLKYTGALALLSSCCILIYKRKSLPLVVFALPFFSYLILIARTGSYMVWDHYYVLTVVPSFAFLIALGLDEIPVAKIAVVIVTVIAAENIGDQINDFRVREPFADLANIESIVDQVSNRNDLIVVNGEAGNPTFLYFTHRRGWAAPNEQLQQDGYLADKITRGCKYLVVAKRIYGDLSLEYAVVYDSETFKIYDLHAAVRH
jgi:4-amino-4-deoxy-L-arabinose transferase-like glycosyltransferase